MLTVPNALLISCAFWWFVLVKLVAMVLFSVV